MEITLWMVAGFVFVAVGCLTLALVLTWELFRDWYRRRRVAARVEEMVGEARSGSSGSKRALVRENRTGGEDAAEEDSAEGFSAVGRRISGLLEKSGSDWSSQSFVIMTLGWGGAFGAALWILTGSLFGGVLGAFAGGIVPYLRLRRQRSRRVAEFEESFPEAIDLMTRAIRAGHPLTSAMRTVGEEMRGPVAEEFRQSAEEQRFGLGFEDAVMSLVDRVDLVDVRIFATAVLTQKEVGGNLAEILDNLAETIRERFNIRRQVRVYTAQGRLSSWILGALPVTVGTAFYFIEPEYVSLLWEETLGLFMLVTAVTMQIIGFIWIRRIVDIEI